MYVNIYASRWMWVRVRDSAQSECVEDNKDLIVPKTFPNLTTHWLSTHSLYVPPNLSCCFINIKPANFEKAERASKSQIHRRARYAATCNRLNTIILLQGLVLSTTPACYCLKTKTKPKLVYLHVEQPNKHQGHAKTCVYRSLGAFYICLLILLLFKDRRPDSFTCLPQESSQSFDYGLTKIKPQMKAFRLKIYI